jgi:hypothetical protein
MRCGGSIGVLAPMVSGTMLRTCAGGGLDELAVRTTTDIQV